MSRVHIKTIGARLARIRGDRSQADFAQQLHVSRRTYWNYEQDKRSPPATLLRALAGMGWNPTWVLTGEGEECLAPETADRDLALDPAAADLLQPNQLKPHNESCEALAAKLACIEQRVALLEDLYLGLANPVTRLTRDLSERLAKRSRA